MSLQMVSYNPDQGTSVLRESNKTFGGFDLSRSDWESVEFNEGVLSKTIEDIYHSEDSSAFNFTSSHLEEIPSNIVLVDVSLDPSLDWNVLPLYIESEETTAVYRGRENFEVIEREPFEGRSQERSTVDLDGGREIISGEEERSEEYYLYNRGEEEPFAYVPTFYNSPKTVVSLEDDEAIWSATDVYLAPDSYLCELCGWSHLYLGKTV